jgi:hypothetical protein
LKVKKKKLIKRRKGKEEVGGEERKINTKTEIKIKKGNSNFCFTESTVCFKDLDKKNKFKEGDDIGKKNILQKGVFLCFSYSFIFQNHTYFVLKDLLEIKT